ncbi:MAG: hypothetical protein QM765_09295 [Myxococcales bacterium]
MSDSSFPSDERSPLADPGLFDWGLLRDWLGFTWRAPRRHPWLAAAAVVGVLGLTAFFDWGFPKTWEVKTQVLAQRNQVMGSLSNPAFVRPEELDAPTRAARETILRWDNLVSLVERTGLVDDYLEKRAPFVRLRDALVQTLTGKVRTRDELAQDLARGLEKHVFVEVGNGVVSVTVRWPDRETAYRLADTVTRSFLDLRQASEVAVIGDAVSVLETHVGSVQGEIDQSLARVIALERETTPRSTRLVRRAAPQEPVGAGPSLEDEAELARLQVQLAAKQRAVSDLEEFRHRRLTELQEQLAAKLAVYSSLHPDVVALRQTLGSLEQPSEQVESLRREGQELERKILEVDRRRSAAQSLARASAASAGAVTFEPPPARSTEDPRLETERGRLRALYVKYWNLRDRTDGARLELDTAKAAFKYRYSVTQPAQLPVGPLKPKRPLVLVAGLLGALVMAFVAGLVADLRSGVLAEPWQIQRRLGLRVLGELRR